MESELCITEASMVQDSWSPEGLQQCAVLCSARYPGAHLQNSVQAHAAHRQVWSRITFVADDMAPCLTDCLTQPCAERPRQDDCMSAAGSGCIPLRVMPQMLTLSHVCKIIDEDGTATLPLAEDALHSKSCLEC